MSEPAAALGEPSDGVLVDASIRGDLHAWERLVRRYQEPVFRVAFLVVRTTDLAEAATQSAFIRAYRALPSLDEGTSLLPWLFRIAAGEARQQRRDSGRPKPSSRPSEDPTGPRTPATAISGATEAEGLTPAERRATVDAFDRLGEEDRLTIASRYLFGLSKEDAAAALSTSIDLVDDNLLIAMKHLRTRMDDA